MTGRNMTITKDHVFTKSAKGEIKIILITILSTAFIYKGVKYTLDYVPFNGLKGVIRKKLGTNQFSIVINSNLSNKEKSKELHRLLRDKEVFKCTGRRNVVSWLK